VISHREADLSDRAEFYISNRLHWQAGGILRIARHRWPIAVYHEAGKGAPGVPRDPGQYQMRAFAAVYRPIALVAVVYSLLRRAQHERDLLMRLQRDVETGLDGSPASERRMVQAQALWSLALYVSQWGLGPGPAAGAGHGPGAAWPSLAEPPACVGERSG
jgi:hypothetical protein